MSIHWHNDRVCLSGILDENAALKQIFPILENAEGPFFLTSVKSTRVQLVELQAWKEFISNPKARHAQWSFIDTPLALVEYYTYILGTAAIPSKAGTTPANNGSRYRAIRQIKSGPADDKNRPPLSFRMPASLKRRFKCKETTNPNLQPALESTHRPTTTRSHAVFLFSTRISPQYLLNPKQLSTTDSHGPGQPVSARYKS